MTACEFAAVGWLIAVFVALYSNRQANKRETRKEIRDKLTQLNLLLSNLLNASTNYYLDKNSFNAKETIKIHESINEAYGIIEDLKEDIKLHNQFHAIFELVTGNDFESGKHRAGEQHAMLCKEIAMQKSSLIIEAEAWFKRTFQ